MSIITISREMAALGDETAHELAKTLKYRIIEKKELEIHIKSYAEADNRQIKYDEEKPTFLASFSNDREDYLHYLKTAVLAEAEQGNCIFVGRGTSLILNQVPGIFSVFLAAPMNIRVERVKNYFHCDDRRARQVIEQSDRKRDTFHSYFFDVDWKEAGNYHLALNTGHLHPGLCAEIIKYLQKRIVTKEAKSKQSIRIKELKLEQAILHGIIYEKGISIHFPEVVVSGDEIRLYGVANSQVLAEAALATALEISGKTDSVLSEIQIVHEYSMIP